MPYGRWPRVTRDEVIAALDCTHCQEFVRGHATAEVDVYAPRRVDVGGGAAYATVDHYGGSSEDRGYTCAVCRRVVSIEENRGCLWTYVPLDRDVVGR
jgi:hypothetical protein